MRKTLLFLIAFFVTSFFLSACGVNSDSVFIDSVLSDSVFIPSDEIAHSGNLLLDIQNFGDLLRTREITEYPGLLEDPTLTAITQEFGFSVISTKSLPFRSAVARASVTPWSSWWYPKSETTLFESSHSTSMAPLVIYDLYQKSRNLKSPHLNPSSAAEYERKHHLARNTPWEGLCDAWALASISYEEPKTPRTFNVNVKKTEQKKISVSVNNLKALLLKTYEGVEDKFLKFYGQKFTGNELGWIYPDIFPEQFHRFIEVQLFSRKQAFIMDHDAGIEVWNVPVFKANYSLAAIPGRPNSIFVRMWLYSAEALSPIEFAQQPNYVGTKEAVREYDYVLEGTRDEAGNLLVKSGYWVKGPDGIDSRRDHPDYFVVIPDIKTLPRRSANPEINVKLVDELINERPY